MANQETIGKELAKETKLVPQDRLETLLESPAIKKRIQEVLRDKAPTFTSSIVSAVKTNKSLAACQPMTVVSSAFVAATLNLPINPSLGFAYIVPYNNVAQFQLGWKGFVQLAIRTNQYKNMHASEVYADELERWDPIKGELHLKPQENWKERYSGKGKVIGYSAFYQTVYGFEKYLYMSISEIEAHAKKYSKSYQKGFGQWKDNFHAMALKTVIKLLLSKYGLLSIDIEKALAVDQAVVDVDGQVQNYPDNGNGHETEDMPNDAIEPA